MKISSRTLVTGAPDLTQLEIYCVTLGLSFPTCAKATVEFIISKVPSNPIILCFCSEMQETALAKLHADSSHREN